MGGCGANGRDASSQKRFHAATAVWRRLRASAVFAYGNAADPEDPPNRERRRMNDNDIAVEIRRRRLLWRASHRGIREMDILVGGFARASLPSMTGAQLDEFEAVIAHPDNDLFDWLIRSVPVPAEHLTATMRALMAFRPAVD
jgi:antitoxin CptB